MRVALVEDEKKLSDLVARALRAQSHAVDVAKDGPGGWSLVQTCEYEDHSGSDASGPERGAATEAYPSQEPGGLF